MGLFSDITHALFGGSSSNASATSTSQSGNQAYPFISSTFGGPAGATGQATSAMGNILGLGGPGQMGQALNNYWNSAGGQFQLNQGLDGLTNRYAALGLSDSGAAMKAMENYRQGLASTYLDNYMNHLGQLGQLGLGAGGLITNAGQFSNSNYQSKQSGDSETGGFGKFLGGLLGFL